MNNIDLTVLMSVYNGEKHIEETINSVLEQSYPYFNFLIINDGSTDNTQGIIDIYADKDKRIDNYRIEKNVGVGKALQIGLVKIKTKYTVKVDADDLSHRDRFKLQIEYLKENKDVSMVGSLINYFPDNELIAESSRFKYLKAFYEYHQNNIIEKQDLREKLNWYNCFYHGSIMGRTDHIKQVGYPSFYIAEDYYLVYHLNKLRYNFAKINKKLVDIRVSSNSTTVREHEKILESIIKIKRKDLEDFLQGEKPIYLWGAGSFGEKLINQYEFIYNTVVGFIDSDKDNWGKKIGGKKVYSPTIIYQKGIKVLVASSLGRFEIAKELKEVGYQSGIDFFVVN
ncbi:glycosyltransferase family 2 protein [Niallia circulans]|uniref:glycosyltransferase family 2 protein n=1 Tax=Niallia circulans TaxID=1397 RepID=UPI002E1BB8B1|nr:glycosyltransferase family 2 protein [Niallia circulans]